MDTPPLSGQPIWSFERAQRHWTGLGAPQLLDQPMTAFFASRQCPGAAIRKAMDWALLQAKQKNVVIGGFHSPLERSILKILLQAGSPAIIVLARPVAKATLLPEWMAALTAAGRLAVVSATSTSERLTSEHAMERNEIAARLADSIVIASASPGGTLAGQCKTWAEQGLAITLLDHAR